jgi:hypothetical protein
MLLNLHYVRRKWKAMLQVLKIIRKMKNMGELPVLGISRGCMSY